MIEHKKCTNEEKAWMQERKIMKLQKSANVPPNLFFPDLFLIESCSGSFILPRFAFHLLFFCKTFERYCKNPLLSVTEDFR